MRTRPVRQGPRGRRRGGSHTLLLLARQATRRHGAEMMPQRSIMIGELPVDQQNRRQDTAPGRAFSLEEPSDEVKGARKLAFKCRAGRGELLHLPARRRGSLRCALLLYQLRSWSSKKCLPQESSPHVFWGLSRRQHRSSRCYENFRIPGQIYFR